MRGLTDDQVSLLLDGHSPDDEPSLSELATFVRSTRWHYVQPPRPGVAERHEAMIAAAARGLPAAGPVAGPTPARRFRLQRLGAVLGSHPRRAVAIAAAGLALGLVGAWAVTDTDRQASPTSSDRPATAPVPERVFSPEPTSQRREGEPGRPSAPDERSVPAPAPEPEPVAPPLPVEQSPPVEPQPEALAERPPPEAETPIEPEAPPHRGYGGPGSTPTPLEGPLDTEPPIPAPPEGTPAP
jgi:hypothetical protein